MSCYRLRNPPQVGRNKVVPDDVAPYNQAGVCAIPTVLFNDSERGVGAVPPEEYLKVLEKFGLS
jgi:predicted DsbA family dithiol-disulfide isomerase